MYVVRTYVRTEYVTLRNVDRNVAGFLPANWVLFAARARRCENYNLEKQISERARGAPGLAELEQLHMESDSRHLFIPQLHNSLA